MVRRPMGTLVKPGLTFGWVVKWKSGLNFVGIPVNDVISTFTYTSNTRAPSLEATKTNPDSRGFSAYYHCIIIEERDKTIPAQTLSEKIFYHNLSAKFESM